MSKVNIILAINGNNQITNNVISEEFNIAKKFEYEFSDLTSTDLYIDLPISKFTHISKIIAQSDNQLKIKVTHLSGIAENFISGVGYLCLDSTYANNISGVAIGTNSTTSVNGFISLIQLA
jgi:hypothetical protein